MSLPDFLASNHETSRCPWASSGNPPPVDHADHAAWFPSSIWLCLKIKHPNYSNSTGLSWLPMICPNKKLQFWGYAVSADVLEIDGEDILTICTFTNHSWKNSSSIPRMKSPHSLRAESFTTRSNSLAAAKSSYGHMGAPQIWYQNKITSWKSSANLGDHIPTLNHSHTSGVIPGHLARCLRAPLIRYNAMA